MASLLIAATPRSGTELLAHTLYSSGEVALAEEYFAHRRLVADYDSDAYLQRIISRAHGRVPAVKLFWDHLGKLEKHLEQAGHQLEDYFPNPYFVWLRRDDILAQAVSWSRAIQTDSWHATRAEKYEPVYMFGQIQTLVGLIQVHNANWEKWFEERNYGRYEVQYAELAANPRWIVRRILDDLGTEPIYSIAPPEWLTPQADDLNAEWIERYRAELRERNE